jgi:type I restriction enzyme S subunit
MYLFYLLLNPELRHELAGKMEGSTGRQRLGKNVLSAKKIPLPPEKEQKRIAAVLSTIQQAIELQDSLMNTTQELKKALMQKLFTEGLRGEAQKETEIGLVPESWEIVPLGKYAKILNGFAFKSSDYVGKNEGIKLIKISNVSLGYFEDKDTKYLPERYIKEKPEYLLSDGDLIIALTRPIIKEGMKYCFVNENVLPALLNQRVGKFEIKNKKLTKQYLFHIVFSKYFVDELKIIAEGSNQPNVSPAKLEEILIPIPYDHEEQLEIANAFSILDIKINAAKSKKKLLTELFNTLLHKLMTAEIRVNELDLSELEQQLES